MSRTILFRSKRAPWGIGLVIAFAVFFEYVVFRDGGFKQVALAIGWPLFFISLCVWLWMVPATTAAPGGIVVRNHFRTLWIPWSHLDEARANLGLYLWVDNHKYFASAPPARGGLLLSAHRQAPVMPELDDTKTVHHVLDVEPIIAAQLLMETRNHVLHPNKHSAQPSPVSEQIDHLLEEHPIPASLDKDFPKKLQIKPNIWPCVITLVLLLEAVGTSFLI